MCLVRVHRVIIWFHSAWYACTFSPDRDNNVLHHTRSVEVESRMGIAKQPSVQWPWLPPGLALVIIELPSLFT